MSDLKQSLMKALLTIPGITEKVWQGNDGDFSSLSYKNKDFAHFHNDNELDLRLTAKIIKAENISRPNRSKYHPGRSNNSPWIELQFTHSNDIQEIIRLVKLAITQL